MSDFIISESTVEAILTEVSKQNKADVVRAAIRKLRDRHGAILNTWPEGAQQRYYALAKELRRLERCDGR